jgi:hypothetical protein
MDMNVDRRVIRNARRGSLDNQVRIPVAVLALSLVTSTFRSAKRAFGGRFGGRLREKSPSGTAKNRSPLGPIFDRVCRSNRRRLDLRLRNQSSAEAHQQLRGTDTVIGDPGTAVQTLASRRGRAPWCLTDLPRSLASRRGQAAGHGLSHRSGIAAKELATVPGSSSAWRRGVRPREVTAAAAQVAAATHHRW